MATNILEVNMYRYNPEEDKFPYIKQYQIEKPAKDIMVLDLLHLLKEQDESISYRRSCREGVCGSDGMNINGKNGLACITPISSVLKKNKIELRPLPGLPVIRDLVVDMTEFYAQYEKIKPFLQNSTTAPEQERLQSPEERDKLDGLYECILCACCSTSCPSFWWNPDKFLGPAALLQAYRFLADTRDLKTNERLEDLSDPFSVYRCHGIMNCVSVCPKGLNPNKAISEIKKRSTHSNIMRPGLGVGGYCLTKDPYFAKYSSQFFFDKRIKFPFVDLTMKTNKNMTKTSLEFIEKKSVTEKDSIIIKIDKVSKKK